MNLLRRVCFAAAIVVLLVCNVPAHANGVDLGVYTGIFNNLDQNFGSYMLWTVTFGDPNALGAIYAPVEFTSYVAGNSYALSGGPGVGSITDASIYGSGCEVPVCTASIWVGNHSDLIGGDSFGRAGVWYFVDVYYGGAQSFNFHFTDPPGSGMLAPMPFSLIEQDYLAGGTPIRSSQGFSLTINPDGTIQDVNVTGMLLNGPGIGSVTDVPEPASFVLTIIGMVFLPAVWSWKVGRRGLAPGMILLSPRGRDR